MNVATIFVLILSHAAASTMDIQTSDQVTANPIRKVVSMLQMMQKRVAAEGQKEADLYDKFLCYCKNSGGALGKSVGDAQTKIPSVGSDIQESQAKLKQDQADVKRAQTDRADAKSAMADAAVIRTKEAAAFAASKSEATSNIASLTGAITAIEKGMTGFLQTEAAQRLKKTVMNLKDLSEYDRAEVVSFLSGAQSEAYAPQSGAITGILKEIKDTMTKNLADEESNESSSSASFEELMAAKTKEVNALTRTIEAKTGRIGEMSVAIVQMQEDLSDTEAGLLQDQKFLKDMDANCATKASEYDANVKVRGDELVALADTIKVLSSDDALEMFKKALPAASSSFLQVKNGFESQRARALAKVADAKTASKNRPGLDFITLALQGKKVNFGKVVTMIDNMVKTLEQEQADDNDKREYCAKQFDFTEDKKKGLERSVADSETEISKEMDALATLKEEIEALADGIKALDSEVASATEQRKEENEDFTGLMSSDAAAKELLGMAKRSSPEVLQPFTGSSHQLRADQAAPE